VSAAWHRVGAFELHPVVEFEGPRMAPQQLLPELDQDRLADLLPRLPAGCVDAASGFLVTSVHTWVVRGPDGLTVLVDTCFGNRKPRPGFPGFHMQETDWLARLGALGVERGQVTHVINTHLHLDHVGWNTELVNGSWRPTFPAARYLMPRRELAAGPSGAAGWNRDCFEDSIAPVVAAGLVRPVEPPHRVASGLTLVAAPGHSPGMMVLAVADGGGGGVLVGGDPLHHPLQLLAPDLSTRFCEDTALAASTRRSLLSRCADEGWAIAATHLVSPRFLAVQREGNAFAPT
jgi:glyoxylase-like metal-dependent hydrolase (beta-lactamase superfamily II)